MNTSFYGRARGVALIEVLVSIAIGLFILAGVVQLFATSSVNARVVTGSSNIQENARYVLSRLERDLKQAGYAGCLNFKAASSVHYFSDQEGDSESANARFKVHVPNPNADAGLYDFSNPVNGRADQAINDIEYDELTIRYASSAHRHRVNSVSASQIRVDNYDDFKTGDIAFIGDCTSFSVVQINNDPSADQFVGFDGGALEWFYMDSDSSVAYLYGGSTGVARYTLDTSAAGAATGEQCSQGSPQFCALNRNGDELVEGVEEFEIEYGWQNADGELYFHPADQMNAARWYLLDRVRVTVTFNSIETTPNAVQGETLTRRSYSRTFMVPNQLPVDYARQVAQAGG